MPLNVPAGTVKQNAVGSTLSTDVTVTSTTYAAFSSTVAITLTATNSGIYRMYGAYTVFCPSSATVGLKIVTTGGNVATAVFVQESIFDTNATTNSRQFGAPYSLYTLTAGLAYTFTLQGKSSAGTLTLNGTAANAIIAADQISN